MHVFHEKSSLPRSREAVLYVSGTFISLNPLYCLRCVYGTAKWTAIACSVRDGTHSGNGDAPPSPSLVSGITSCHLSAGFQQIRSTRWVMGGGVVQMSWRIAREGRRKGWWVDDLITTRGSSLLSGPPCAGAESALYGPGPLLTWCWQIALLRQLLKYSTCNTRTEDFILYPAGSRL